MFKRIIFGFELIVYACIAFIIGIPTQLFSQNIFSHSYSSLPGLPTNIFYAVEQDADGAMWFVTQVGVVRYDGVKWNLLPDSLGLPVQENTSLISLKEGGVALAGMNSKEENILAIYRENSWEIVHIPETTSVIKKYLIGEFEGRIKAAYSSRDSLYYYTGKSNTWAGIPLISKKNNLSKIRNLRFYKDKIYVICPEGIYYGTNLKTIQKLTIVSDVLPSSDFFDLGWSAGGDSLFIIGEDFLALNTNKRTFLLVQDQKLNQIGGDIYSDISISYPFVYYTCSSHLYLYDLTNKKSLKIDAHEKGIIGKWNGIKIDRQGILWLVNARGVSKLPSLAFSNFSNKYFLEDEVSVVLHLKNGSTFLGHNIGFSIVDNNMNLLWDHSYVSKNGFSRILNASEGKNGEIYAASIEFGLIKISPGIKKVNYFKEIPTATSVKTRNDTVWVGTMSSVITLVDDKVVSKLDEDYIRGLEFDVDGKLLLLQLNGIKKLGVDNFKGSIKTSAGKYNSYFAGEYKDRLLVATLGGLYYYSNKRYDEFIIGGKHFKQPVYTFVVDENNDLWIGTSNGIYQVRNSEVVNHFDAANGLVSNEINRAALVFDSQSNLWIGLDKGLSIYNKHLDNPIRLSPLVAVNSIYNNGKSYLPLQEAEFAYENRDVEFFFSAYSFYNETSLNFEYKLNGFDANWKTIGNYGVRSIKYNNLPPGEYSFSVRAREAQRGWSEVAKSAVIEINTPFYFSPWFILFCLIGATFFVVFVTTFINQKKLAKNLDKKLQEKMKEVIDSKNELSIQNKELKNLNIQLDSFAYSVSHDLRAPIASSLGLINLLKLDKENSETYFGLIEKSMNRMDSFIKDVLEVSKNSRTEIKVDKFNLKQLLTEVIDNQRYREGAQGIEFKIEAKDEMITTDKRRLYVLLTNLISNAISYSDYNKPKRIVDIDFFNKNKKQVVVVKDNGLGIQQKYLSSLFNIFFRAGETSTGSGLGLYIADQTVKKLNGTITVESEFGQWTKFKIVLPI